MDETHLKLSDRTLVTGFILCTKILKAQKSSAKTTEDFRLIRDLEVKIRDLYRKLYNRSMPAKQLDEELEEWINFLISSVNNAYLGERSLFIKEVTSQLNEAKGNIKCLRCAKNVKTEICDDTQKDFTKIMEGGECLSIFNELFETTCSKALVYYSKFFPEVNFNKMLVITFATRPIADPPHRRNLALYLNGRTEYFDNESRAKAVIFLELYLKDFNWESFLSIPYILFHEVFIHAFDSVLPAGLTREAYTDQTSVFLDGWMDYVALMILKDEVDDCPFMETYNFITKANNEFFTHGKRLYLALENCDDPEEGSFAPERYKAHQAANRIEALFKKHFSKSDYNQGKEMFLDISFGLNVNSKYIKLRDNLVAVFEALFLTGSSKSFEFEREEMLNIFGNYLNNQSLDQLVHDAFEIEKKIVDEAKFSSPPKVWDR